MKTLEQNYNPKVFGGNDGRSCSKPPLHLSVLGSVVTVFGCYYVTLAANSKRAEQLIFSCGEKMGASSDEGKKGCYVTECLLVPTAALV